MGSTFIFLISKSALFGCVPLKCSGESWAQAPGDEGEPLRAFGPLSYNKVHAP